MTVLRCHLRSLWRWVIRACPYCFGVARVTYIKSGGMVLIVRGYSDVPNGVTVDCPVCHGTGKRPVPAPARRLRRFWTWLT